MATATLLLSSPDRKGLVSTFSNFIFVNNGNILDADHHIDSTTKIFLTRIVWELDDFKIPKNEIQNEFSKIANSVNASWSIHFSDVKKNLAIFVTKQDHCLNDLLWRVRSNELNANISFIVGNHPDLEPTAKIFGIPFFHIPVSPDSKSSSEAIQLELIQKYKIDLVILAKYMQILSEDFILKFPNVINIHHSFLPAFAGANPYKRAFERGVKIIGATAHFVTKDLDEGPIIEQEIVRVSHRDDTQDLIRKGRDLEKIVLSRAVHFYTENKILVFGNKTVIFE
ncbi:MAG: formyltetrahydrofolate deformylase [Leptospiraceae bacterium]|nr:formyltetrahydrofolate deformylase [Leptospiraceae bacterium]